mmetsp:Transcript_29694/g.28550  ORF Transcript_29694/g.28550 Transcript_29694/m.28550 type:complete len:226 (-) Transcript_29694:118-795(-)
MGRYTTVQSYTDNNPNMRAVSYEQAKGGVASGNKEAAAASAGAPRPDKVFNPYGSTAGAGSSEFHVYRHARTREMIRMSQLDEEEKEKNLEQEYQNKVKGWQVEEQIRTERKRKKRKRGKLAKERKKNMMLAGVCVGSEDDTASANGKEEFEYTPLARQREAEKEVQTAKNDFDDVPKVPFANNGSFLEIMKQALEKEKLGNEKKVCNVKTKEDCHDVNIEAIVH